MQAVQADKYIIILFARLRAWANERSSYSYKKINQQENKHIIQQS